MVRAHSQPCWSDERLQSRPPCGGCTLDVLLAKWLDWSAKNMLNTVQWAPGVLHLAPTQAAALLAGGFSGCDSDDKTGEPPNQPDWSLLCRRSLRTELEAPAAPAC